MNYLNFKDFYLHYSNAFTLAMSMLAISALLVVPAPAEATNSQPVCNDQKGNVHVDYLKKDGSTAIAKVTNTASNCKVNVNLTSYEAYSPYAEPGSGQAREDFLDSQISHDHQDQTLKAGKSATMQVDLPSCLYQVDIYVGEPIHDLGPNGHSGVFIKSFRGNYDNVCGETPEPLSCPLEETEGSQVINFVDLNDPSIIRSDMSASDARSDSKSLTLSPGAYKVSLASYDNHDDKSGQTQPNEQYFVELDLTSGSSVNTNSIYDLPDNQNYLNQIVNGELVLSSTTTSATAVHTVYPDDSNPNSVVPLCAKFEQLEEEDPELTGQCSVNPQTVEPGQDVQFSATASGGTGSYDYSWAGTDGVSTTSQSFSTSYNSTGTKSATVTITSGDQSIERTCDVTVREEDEEDPELTGQCSINPQTAEPGEEVDFSASANGGTGSYSYSWTGSDDISTTSQSFSKSFDSTGTKSATVTITSGDQSIERSCSVTIDEEDDNGGGGGDNDDDDNGGGRGGGGGIIEPREDDDDGEVAGRRISNLALECTPSDDSVLIGQRVTFDADADGGDGDYEFDWDGERIEADDDSASATYLTAGTKVIRVTVESDGDEETALCEVDVIRGQVQGTTRSITLGDVPRTGPSDTAQMILFILTLLGISATGAYAVMNRKQVETQSQEA